MFKIKNTIDHLYNLLTQESDIESILITKVATLIHKTQGEHEVYITDPNQKDAIQALYDNVSTNPNICVDCMTDDNIRHNEFFKHSIKAYIEFLIINYGPAVPISKEMAKYFIKHNLLEERKVRYAYSTTAVLIDDVKDFCLLHEEKFLLSVI